MITRDKSESIVQYLLDYAKGKAQGAEVTISASDIATSRFANNGMTQNQAPDHVLVSVRVLKNGRQARLSSDKLSVDSLRNLVDDAVSACKFLEKDEGLQALAPMPSKPYQKVRNYDGTTAQLGPDERSKAIKKIVKIAEAHGLNSAGVVSTGSSLLTIANSKGLHATHKQSSAECSITMYRNAATGWAKSDVVRFDQLAIETLAKRAASKAAANVDPVEIPPGRYQVILEPSAVLDLVGFLAYDFTATSHLDQLSCFEGQLGQKVLGENISILDDVADARQAGAPFDGEGIPRQSIQLVENGVIKNWVCGRRSARKMDMKATGHGLSEPSAEGEYPQNLVFAGGTATLEDMIKETEKAVLLTRVWYIREIEPKGKIVTGMTRDGTFLVENGRVLGAVKNLRFNQSIVDMLNNVEKMGVSERTAGEEALPAAVPPMVVNNFNFASTTTF